MPMQRSVGESLRLEKFVQLSENVTVQEAARQMKTRNCGAAVVTYDGRLIGIFTERDLLNRVVGCGRDPAQTRLSEVISQNPLTVSPGATVAEALKLMESHGFRHLPVVNNGQVIGMVSQRDLLDETQTAMARERRLWDETHPEIARNATLTHRPA